LLSSAGLFGLDCFSTVFFIVWIPIFCDVASWWAGGTSWQL